MTHSADDIPPSSCRQPLCPSLLHCIRWGEYVNSAHLLPSPSGIDPDCSRCFRRSRSSSPAKGSSNICEHQIPLPKITSIDSWPWAWSCSLLAVNHYYTVKAVQMIKYQDQIITAAEHFSVGSWYSYNNTLRLKLSHDHSLWLDHLDGNLWAFWYATQACPLCCHCHRYGYLQMSCPVGKSYHSTKTKDGCIISSTLITTPAPTLTSVATPMSASSVRKNTHPRLSQVTATLDPLDPFNPIDVAQLEHKLSLHPDKPWTSQLINSLTEDGRVNFTIIPTARTAPNLASAHLHPEVIDNKLSNKCSKAHIVAPYPTLPLSNLQCPVLASAKKEQNLADDYAPLCSQHAQMINDGINKEDYSLHYSSLDDATHLVAKLGKNYFLAKINLKSTSALFLLQPLTGKS